MLVTNQFYTYEKPIQIIVDHFEDEDVAVSKLCHDRLKQVAGGQYAEIIVFFNGDIRNSYLSKDSEVHLFNHSVYGNRVNSFMYKILWATSRIWEDHNRLVFCNYDDFVEDNFLQGIVEGFSTTAEYVSLVPAPHIHDESLDTGTFEWFPASTTNKFAVRAERFLRHNEAGVFSLITMSGNQLIFDRIFHTLWYNLKSSLIAPTKSLLSART